MKKENKKTIGIDLGDKKHHLCILDAHGEILEQRTITNSRSALDKTFKDYRGSLAIMEVGTHSPWISRFLENMGLQVIVANARKLRAIHQNERKSDQADAEMLARLGRADPKLLHPLKHRKEISQQHLLMIKSRDHLVKTRVGLINAIRSSLKSLGYLVTNPSSSTFTRKLRKEVPPEVLLAVEKLMDLIDQINASIKSSEKSIQALIDEHYPEASHLQQIPGVGPITALSFVLKIECTNKFKRIRDIGPYLGLTPRRDQSGSRDKPLPITKCGDKSLRTLLVKCSQYILGHFGPPSQLRDFGLRLAQKGAAVAKKKAVIAVARKLSMLMLSLWKNNATYQPQGTFQHA